MLKGRPYSISAAVCSLCTASPALSADSLLLTDPAAYPILQALWERTFWTTPVFFLLQLGALLVLLWQVLNRWSPDRLGARLVGRWLLQFGVVVAPVVMLFMSAIFVGVYQGQRGHWFFHLHDGLAGLALIPFYVVGSIIVTRGIFQRDYRYSSGLHFLVLQTLTAVCLWYAFATAFLDMASDSLFDMRFAAIVPAVSAANYALLAIDIRRTGRLKPAPGSAVIAWFTALAVTFAVKVPLAIRFFAALPPERPAGYGDCFVVSAAARGHPRIVGSHYDPQLERTVNRQWRTLRAFESQLELHQPALHFRLRGLYNYIGPRIAARVRSPLTADFMFLLLKPIEWFARLYLSISSRS